MTSANLVSLLLVLKMLLVPCIRANDKKPCSTDGWFGRDCQYQCHCAESAPCDKRGGSCSSGCGQGWFGPACQYELMNFTGSDLNWLTDNDNTTCNNGSLSNVTVSLLTPIPLTWIRAVFKKVGTVKKDNQTMMQMSYKTDYNAAWQVCPQENTAMVDDVTLDIFCPSKDRVLNVSLSGPGVGSLCSLYISGGRNLALRQRANQSSRLIPDGETDKANAGSAEYAVDGTVHTDQCSSPQQIILSHTRSENDGNISSWWSLTFSESVNISRFLIYSGNDSNTGLKSFALTASTTGGSDTTFIDRGKVQTVYTVVPSPRICFPVDEVRIEQEIGENKTFSLCEVFVFGEKSCPAGTFGLDCERKCNCTNQISCFVHSGGCPSGYSPDYSSMECPVLSAAIEPKKLSESTCANCTRICSAASPATGSRNDGNDPQLCSRKTCSRRNPATDEQSGNTDDSAVPAIVAVVVVVVVFALIVALVLLWRRCLKKSARSQGEETGISLKSMQETVK